MILHNYPPKRREQFKKIKEYKCSECGIGPIWNGKDLLIQLDHIDGQCVNHHIDNLRWLCPNCHSQTSTYCAGNRGNGSSTSKRKQFELFLNSMNQSERESYLLKTSYADINASFNISYQSIRKVLNNLGLGKKPKKLSHRESIVKAKFIPTKEFLEQRIHKENVSLLAIGRELGISDNAVRKWCLKYGVSCIRKGYRKTKLN